MLTGRGLIAGHTKAPPGQRAYAVVSCTEAGAAFLRSQQPLVLQLSGELLAQEKAARAAAEAAAAAAAAAAALEAQRNVVQAEEHRLFRALLDVRKASGRQGPGGGTGCPQGRAGCEPGEQGSRQQTQLAVCAGGGVGQCGVGPKGEQGRCRQVPQALT